MTPAPFGVALSFEVTFDSNSLSVGMSVYDDSGSSPSLVSGPSLMANVVGSTYRGKFTPSAGKPYIIVKAVYTDNTLTVLNTNYNAGSEAIIAVMPPNPAAVTIPFNAAFNNFEFPMQNSSGGPVTGATVTAIRSINGGAFAPCANAASEVGSGVYAINLAASDLDGTFITFIFTATGALPTRVGIATQP